MHILRRFSVRLVAWFVALAIVPAAVMAAIAYIQLRDGRQEQVTAHLATAASGRAAAIEAMLGFHGADLRSENGHIFAAGGRVPVDRVHTLLRRPLALHETAATYLVDADGRVVGGAPPPASEDLLEASAAVGSWRVVAAVDRAEALAPVQSLALRLLALGGVFLVAVTGAVYYFGRRTERSVEAMVGAVQRAGRGDFGGAVESHAFKEVDRIGDEITAMHERLAERDKEILEQRRELFCQRCELERLNSEIVEADRLKSEFVANMSHEVRTPLHSILTLSGVLLEQRSGPLEAEQQKQVGIIERNGRALLAMLGDILDFSKIEAGRMAVTPSEVVAGAALAGVREVLAADAHAKGLTFDLDVADGLDPLHTDAEKLHRVLLNLAHNAVKFTKAGRVTLRAGPREHGGVVFAVADTGPGIPADQLENVFEPFHQADGSTTRVAGGTGLGLSIAKKLTELMGGRIAVRSEVGRGTTFEVSLPRRGPVRAPAAGRPAAANDVLVVGETIASAEALRAELAVAGFHAGRAVCGRDVRTALDRDVGAILLDVGMFRNEGVDVLSALAPRLAADETPLLGYWIDAEQGCGGVCGPLSVHAEEAGARLEGEQAPPLPLPRPVADDDRRAGAAWANALRAGDDPLRDVVRRLIARLDAVLENRAPRRAGGRRLVLLDPDEDARYSMTLQLDPMGFHVGAFARLDEVPSNVLPDVVVTEAQLDDAPDAVAACAARFDAPVVLLTADARPETAARAREAGAALVQTKPYPAAALVRALDGLLAGAEA